MEDWMTPEEKSIIIPHIMGPTMPIPDSNTPLYVDSRGKEDNKEKLKKVKREKFTFETGSTYDGEWDAFGMSGKGIFKMFNGVYYAGEMDDGMFDGKGTVWYPNCCRLEGVWKRGNLQQDQTHSIIYNDNLTFKEEDWDYCTEDDRRFLQEIRYGINPTGRTLLSATVPPKQIPPGCYDTGDGFYNPLTKCVYNAQGEIIRIPKRSEEKFIMDNYRKSAGIPSYKLPGVHPFPQESPEYLDQTHKVTIVCENVDKEMEMEEDMLTTDTTEEEASADKCVGRYNLLEIEDDGRKFQILDENESSQNLLVDLPILKVRDRKLIINPNPDLLDSDGKEKKKEEVEEEEEEIRTERVEEEEEKEIGKERVEDEELMVKEGVVNEDEVVEEDEEVVVEEVVNEDEGEDMEEPNIMGKKLALLLNIFKRVDEVGGPHKLTKEDCKYFKKQLAVHLSKSDVYIDSKEIELGFHQIEDIDRSYIHKAISDIVEEIFSNALEYTD